MSEFWTKSTKESLRRTLGTVYTVSDVARFFRVNERTVYRWVEAGILHPLPLGATKRFSEEEIRRIYNASHED